MYLVFCIVFIVCLRDTRVLSCFSMVKFFVKLLYDMGMICYEIILEIFSPFFFVQTLTGLTQLVFSHGLDIH